MILGETETIVYTLSAEAAFTITEAVYTVYDASSVLVGTEDSAATVYAPGTAEQELRFSFTPAAAGSYRVVYRVTLSDGQVLLFEQIIPVQSTVATTPTLVTPFGVPTLGDIERDTILLLREFDGDAASGDPITLRRSILRGTDDLAQNSDCFWYADTVCLRSGQSTYLSPSIYKPKAASFQGSDGTWQPLRPARPHDLDRQSGTWRQATATAGTYPTRMAVEGMNRVRLHPIPYLAGVETATLEIEGYAVPGGCTKEDGVTPLFADANDPFPLPLFAAAALPYYVAKDRAIQFAGDPVKRAQGMLAQREYDKILGNLCAFAANYAAPYRFGGASVWRG